jgi:FkbM family methyltransferase
MFWQDIIYFLKLAKNFKKPGIIHIGAHDGSESHLYNHFGISNCIWIEADPFVFKKLKRNIGKYKNYIALNYLVCDKKKKYKFNIASNQGGSSSIFKFKDHIKIDPNIYFIKKIILKSMTIPEIIKKHNISSEKYQSLVLDVQGSELLVLKSYNYLLRNFKYIKLEATNFEVYLNNPTVDQLSRYLLHHNFKEIKRFITFENNKLQKVYEIIYQNNNFITKVI